VIGLNNENIDNEKILKNNGYNQILLNIVDNIEKCLN
jgi:hypothetical protein